LEPGYVDPRGRVVELNKAFTQHDLASTQYLKEGVVTRNGIEGWQMELTANMQGHDLYIVTWIAAENGFGYILSTWGPSVLKNEIQSTADQMFSNFELIR
jgi:hypothetical protein